MKTIAFDLDDTLCSRAVETGGIEKYHTCKPIPNMIKIVKDCFDQGYEVIIYTARGMGSLGGNRDEIIHHLYDLTRDQLAAWDVKYHKLIMGKAHYDLLIDDKVMNIKDVSSAADILEKVK